MARESCNLDKDEAEIFKPSSSSSPSASPSSPPSSSSSSSLPPPPSSMLLKSCEESVIQRSERSSSSSPPPPPPSMLLNPCEESAIQKSERPESPAPAPEITIAVSFTSKPGEETQARVRFSNRCSTCRKKVGLTGFRCRCGDLFCGRHRYSDAHECSFDYKAAGREEIAKANPVIKAAKIIKI